MYFVLSRGASWPVDYHRERLISSGRVLRILLENLCCLGGFF